MKFFGRGFTQNYADLLCYPRQAALFKYQATYLLSINNDENGLPQIYSDERR